MTGRFLIITAHGDTTVYVPLSRFLRMEASPGLKPEVPTVSLYFEGNLKVVLQVRDDPRTMAGVLYDRLVRPEDQDNVYLRPDDRITEVVLSRVSAL